jgi:hypothetical protein
VEGTPVFEDAGRAGSPPTRPRLRRGRRWCTLWSKNGSTGEPTYAPGHGERCRAGRDDSRAVRRKGRSFALAREERQISPGDPPKKPDRSWTRPLSRAGAPLAALGDDDEEGTIADPNMRAAPREQTEFPVPDDWERSSTRSPQPWRARLSRASTAPKGSAGSERRRRTIVRWNPKTGSAGRSPRHADASTAAVFKGIGPVQSREQRLVRLPPHGQEEPSAHRVGAQFFHVQA